MLIDARNSQGFAFCVRAMARARSKLPVSLRPVCFRRYAFYFEKIAVDLSLAPFFLVVFTAVRASPMLRHATPNCPSSA
jgi:hypothetical protein